MESSDYIFGLRAVMEAIEAGKEIDKIFVKKDMHGDLAAEFFDMARANDILIQRVPVEKLNK